MSAPRPDPLAGWRAARAARAAEAAPAVAATVATVATVFPAVATAGEARKTAVVATVSTVSGQTGKERVASAPRDAWGLSETDKAGAVVRLCGAHETTEPEAMDHDAAERAAMAAHYAAEGEAQPYQPGQPDPLRDGLFAGALQMPPAWADPALTPPPGAWCSCCGRFDRTGGRWWTSAPEPDGWACVTCHPPDHLPPDAVREVRT